MKRLLLLAGLAACGTKGHAEVEGVLIPQADGVIDAPDGSTLAVDVDTIDGAVVPSGAPVVRLAVGRQVPWDKVTVLMDKVVAAGRKPQLLAGKDHKVKGFRLEDAKAREASKVISIIAYIDGKACVQPPGSIEAKCVQSGDRRQIDRAFLRELVREQVKRFDIQVVEIELAGGLPFGDVVRTIDAARTCCYETAVSVRLKRGG